MENVPWTAGLKGTPFDPEYVALVFGFALVIWILEKLFKK